MMEHVQLRDTLAPNYHPMLANALTAWNHLANSRDDLVRNLSSVLPGRALEDTLFNVRKALIAWRRYCAVFSRVPPHVVTPFVIPFFQIGFS
jgi:hypothetical protein